MNAQDEHLSVLITSLDDYQAAAIRTAANLEPGEPSTIITMALGLSGEAGEAAEIIKKWFAHGHELDHPALKKELGDILWYLAGQAHANGWTLSEIASANIAKLRARYPDGFSTAESLKRCACGHHRTDHDHSIELTAPCETGGTHSPTTNEHNDAWCSKCGERLLLPRTAGYDRTNPPCTQCECDNYTERTVA